MKLSISSRRKIGDILSDLGKYVLTAVPIAYFVSSSHELSWEIIILIAICGILLCFSGVYIINTADEIEQKQFNKSGNLHKIILRKNSTLTFEDLKI